MLTIVMYATFGFAVGMVCGAAIIVGAERDGETTYIRRTPATYAADKNDRRRMEQHCDGCCHGRDWYVDLGKGAGTDGGDQW